MSKRLIPIYSIRAEFDAEVAKLGKLAQFRQERFLPCDYSKPYGVIFQNRSGTYTARWFSRRNEN